MSYECIRLERHESVVWLVLNRPQVLNALNAAMVSELADALASLHGDAEARAVVLTGEGRAFSTGGDLKAGIELREKFGPTAPADRFLGPMQDVLRQIRDLPQPVIAAVNGHCLAGGLELALCCDIVLASVEAQFGDPRAVRGMLPALGGVIGLTRAVGLFKAREMLLTCANYSAADMYDAGLVSSVHELDQLRGHAQAMAQGFAGRNAGSVALIKRMFNEEQEMTWDEAARHELRLNRQRLTEGTDVSRGLAEFRDRPREAR